jgi:hypothetical protein
MKKLMVLALFVVAFVSVACGDSTAPANNPSSAPTASGSAAAPADSAATTTTPPAK